MLWFNFSFSYIQVPKYGVEPSECDYHVDNVKVVEKETISNAVGKFLWFISPHFL